MNTPSLTPIQRQNLAKLTLYVASLPADYQHFNMEFYVRNGGFDGNISPVRKMIPACGTSACFAGHGPHAGINPLPGEVWEDYVKRNFINQDDDGNWPKEFDWLFGSFWEHSIHDAIKRAAWLLQTGDCPKVEEIEDEETGEGRYSFDDPDGWPSFTPNMELITRIAQGDSVN